MTIGTARYTHCGVALKTGPSDIPRSVRSHIFKGGYEPVEVELVTGIVTPSDRVLEVGTGIGFVSILCAKLAGEGHVTSYEANPVLEPIIGANYAPNGLSPDLRMKAVTVDGSPIRFFADPNILSSSLIDRDLQSTEITVDSDPMVDVMAEIAPNVIVMDVEGAEVDLLTAADLSSVRAMIVEVHPTSSVKTRSPPWMRLSRCRGCTSQSDCTRRCCTCVMPDDSPDLARLRD